MKTPILFLFLVGSLSISSCAFPDDRIMIIANHKVDEALNKNEIKEIFLGRRTRWKDNVKVKIVLSRNPKILQQFVTSYVDKTKSQFMTYWKMQVFTGTGRMPKSLKKQKDIINFVANTKGSIGFIGWLDKIEIDGVRTILIEQGDNK